MRMNSLTRGVFAGTVLLAVSSAFGDVLPLGDFPLHRIGIELVLTYIATALGGGMMARWILKRGWKFDNEVTRDERQVLMEKIKCVLPRLTHRFVGVRLLKLTEMRPTTVPGDDSEAEDEVESVLRLNPDLARELNGVPIEWVASELEKQLEVARQSIHNAHDTIPILYYEQRKVWASREEEREMRLNWHSPSEHMDVIRGALEEMARRRRCRRLVVLLLVLLPFLFWLAWWLGQVV